MTTTNTTTAVESGHDVGARAAAEHDINLDLQDLLFWLEGFMCAGVASGALEAVCDHHPLIMEAMFNETATRLPYATAQAQEQRALAYFLGLQAIKDTPGTLDAIFLGLRRKLLGHISPLVARLAEVALEDEDEAAYQEKRQRLCEDIDAVFAKHKQAGEGDTPPA